MARCGNHGQIIPRDKELLECLYWNEQKSLPEIGRIYGVTHKSVECVFRALGIERRKRHTKGQSKFKKCVKCGDPVHKIKHATNGSQYGRFCKKHFNEHRSALQKEYAKIPRVKKRLKQDLKRWYYTGAKAPEGEIQWLNQNKIMLRNVRRLLLKSRTENREALRFLSKASKPARSSRTSCRQ